VAQHRRTRLRADHLPETSRPPERHGHSVLPRARAHRDLHSFPTRRSSDLDIGVDAAKTGMLFSRALIETVAGFLAEHRVQSMPEIGRAHVELQSRGHLVCRLLLEKKKQETSSDCASATPLFARSLPASSQR